MAFGVIGLAAALALLAILHVDVGLACDDRLDALIHRLDGEFQRAEEIVGVGNRKRRLVVGQRLFEHGLDGQCALEQRISRMHAQMDETGPVLVPACTSATTLTARSSTRLTTGRGLFERLEKLGLLVACHGCVVRPNAIPETAIFGRAKSSVQRWRDERRGPPSRHTN